ncbi:hypothetical protein Sjap_006473 [Stephania japonica]|uniref:Uncharacterized protein n=1 Tax=Stephania japonica TaxID=461633 RepID=A0AAP0K727_9MAGN
MALPSANRLIKHLKAHGVPMAVASNFAKASIETKIFNQQGWKESFSVIGADEVSVEKPSPEICPVISLLTRWMTSSCCVRCNGDSFSRFQQICEFLWGHFF